MYSKLIQEYMQSLKKHHININDIDKNPLIEEEIFELNMNIINNKNNKVNKLLNELFSNRERDINFTNLKAIINFEPLLNLIESYLQDNKISYLYNNVENEIENIQQCSYIKIIVSTGKPPYKPDEERKVFEKLDKHNKYMVNEIICHNYGLILKMLNRYSNSFFSNEDLFSLGILGLYKAIDRFDVSKGYKFSTYATFWIRQMITREIANKKYLIRIPICTQENLKIYNKSIEMLTEKLNRTPNIYEISKHSKFTISQIKELEKANIKNMSLQSTIQDHSDATIEKIIPSEENIIEYVENKLKNEELNQIINSINTSERNLKVLKMRYGIYPYQTTMTLEEIGDEMHISKERVRLILESLHKKIKKELEQRNLMEEYDETNSKTYQKK